MPRDGDKIVLGVTPARERRATPTTKPMAPAPASPPIHETVAQIVEWQKLRKFCIKAQQRADRSTESFVAGLLGYSPAATEKERKAIFQRAGAIRKAVEDGKDVMTEAERTKVSFFVPALLSNAAARSSFDDNRAAAEKALRKLAMTLPVYAWVKENARGLGELGLAVIVAEAGIPIGEYRTVSGLWKRLGLAVINGERQRRVANKEMAVEHGYSPSRRAQIWAQCSDSMFRAQWRGADEETGEVAHPIGRYGEVYARRRARTAPRIDATADLPLGDPAKWTKGRCHNDGRRVMTKALLVDLWVTWRASL